MAKKRTAEGPQWEIKDRIYVLKGGMSPVNYILRSKHSNNKPLQYFDGSISRSLRFASNQQSIFVDEQHGEATLPAIVFQNGKLQVPKEQVLLQQFLSVFHPDLNRIYIEFDPNAEAEKTIVDEEAKLDAQNLVRDMDIEDLEAIARVILKSKVSDMTSKEIRRDMLVYARKNPQEIQELANDENIKLRNVAIRAVEMGLIKLMDDKRTFCWNDSSKEKIVTIPFGENAYSALASYFKTDEGLDVLQDLTNKL